MEVDTGVVPDVRYRLDVARFDAAELTIHFARHRADFVAVSETEYEGLANRFLSGTLHSDLLQCTRKQGDIVRYNVATTEFGVLSSRGIIRTYFKAKPCASLPPTAPKVGCHGYSDNLQYFKIECLRTW